MGQFSKKVVSTVVTFATVLSSVGVGAFAVPSVASAATLMNGDLIKASGPAVYYYMDGQRYTFPTEKTYLSWFSDFSRVRTISDTELSGIQLAMKNVTMRAGTQLVKITTDPKVYAVTAGGVLHWVQGNEAFAASLFGSNWARRVVDVPDGFFTNYSIGAPITTAVHPDGTLVTYAGSADRFVVVGGQIRRVTDAGFSANMFQLGNVLSTTISYPMSTAGDVMARESALSDAIMMAGGSSTTPTPVGGSVMATLASDTPSAMVLPKNAQSVMFTKVNLMAGSASARVTGVKFHRVGVGSTSDFSNVYLYNANGTRLTSGRTISTATNMVEFNGLTLDIAAGSTLTVYLSADLSSPSTTGGQHAFELADASSVVLSGTGSVSGSFPVRGNAMTVGTASVARVDVINGSTPADPRVGVADAELANFRLQANGSNDVQLRRVTLYQSGTVSNSDLSNLHLFQGTTDLGSASSVGSDGKIVINFATPFLIPNGQSRTFNLRGAVAGRSGRTIRIYAEYSSDMYLVDSTYGIGAQVCTDSTSPCSGSYDGSGSTTTNASYSTTQGGQFTISFNGPATTNVGRGQNDAVFYRFAITSGSNDVEIRRFNFTATTTGSGIYDGTTEYLRDIKIKDADTGEVVAGPVSCTTSCAAPGYKAFNTSVSVLMHAGQTRNFVITADTSNSITDGSTYKFGLGGASGDLIFGSTDLRITSSGEFLATTIPAPNTTVTGNTMTVLTPSLNVTLAGTPSSGVYVKNQTDIPSSAFTITAGSQSDVRVTSLKVTGRGNTAGAYSLTQLYNVVNSCGLYDGDTAIGTRQSPSATDGTMTFSSLNLSIARGTSKTLSTRCTADSTVAQTAGDAFAVGIALAADISAQDADGNTVSPSLAPAVVANAGPLPTVAQTVKSGGTLTVAANNQRQSTILVADGSTWQVLSRYRADAQYEDITIDYVGVTSTGPAANFTSGAAVGTDGVSGGVAVVQSSDSDCRTFSVRGSTSLPSGVSQAAEVDLSTSPITVPKGSTTYVCLLGRLANTVASSTNSDVTGAPRSGNVVALGIPAGALTVGGSASSIFTSTLFAGNLDIRATGAASGDRVYQAGSQSLGNAFIVRRAVPVVTQQNTGLSTTLASGQRTLYRAQIGSQGGQASIKQLTFKVAVTTTSNMTLANFRLQKNGADMNSSDVSITDAYGVNLQTSTMDVHTSPATTTVMVIVRFASEETVLGTGNTYALNATVGGLSSTTGDSITTALANRTFSGTVAANAITGYLSQTAAQLTVESEDAGLVTINTAATPLTTGVTGDNAYGMLWSDMSEGPHYSNIFTGSEAASRDWTNEYLVNTISGSMVMSK